MSRPDRSLENAHVLVLEDECFLADDLAKALRDAGGLVVGPVATIAAAEGLVATERVDAAIVDLNLRGHLASDFIGQLAAGGLPCLIVSGYGDDALPEAIQAIPRVEKPVSASSVVTELAAQLKQVA